MTRITKVSRLEFVPGIGVDRTGNAADAAQDPEMLRLENMDTDIAPPQVAIEATRKAVSVDENNSYLPFWGQDELRRACVRRVSRVCGAEYDFRSECIITAGGMSGILNCLLATLEPGDEVIVTDPTYAGIINRIRLSGAIPVFVPLIATKEGWRLDMKALEKVASPKTRMFVASPGMPSGHVYTQEEWEAVARLCIKNDIWLLYDAAMERILYDGRKIIHPVSMPGMRERTITVGAASKELRMIGWRVGWVVGPNEIMSAIGLVSIANVVCQTGISMPGVAAALNAEDDGLNDALKLWQERRDTLVSELAEFPVTMPHAGWSLLLDAEALGVTAEEVVERLFTKAKVAVTPMFGWGATAGKYVRFVFANEPKERLMGIGQKIKQALKN